MADDTSGFVRSLGFTTEQLVGYAYTGFLFLACLAIVDAPSVKSLSDAVGSGVLVFMALAAGVAVFTFYFRLVGELVLFPVQYFLHHWLDKLIGRHGETHSATLSFLHFLGIPWTRCHPAYQELKAHFYSTEDRSQIHISHGELHVLYVTATTLLGFAAYTGTSSSRFELMLIPGLAVLAGAFLADTIQQSIETYALRSADRAQLVAFLQYKGLIAGSVTPSSNAHRPGYITSARMAHVGIVSNNLHLFESFWCTLIGFSKTWESDLPTEKAQTLFGVATTAKIVRYSGFGDTQLEVHVPMQEPHAHDSQFFQIGLNHVCIEISKRDVFLQRFPNTVKIHRYLNPGGWENVFVRDFEGNWLEIRQTDLGVKEPAIPSMASNKGNRRRSIPRSMRETPKPSD